MKKIIAICLVLIITFSFISCNSSNNLNHEETKPQSQETKSVQNVTVNTQGELVINYNDGTQENLGKINNKTITSTYINDAGELIITYSDNTQENLGLVVSENVWRERNDIIYSIVSLNIRSTPNSNSNIVDVVSYGTELHRVSTNGTWAKIKYQGTYYYVRSEYTTTNQQDILYEENTKIVYANKMIYLWKYPYQRDYSIECIPITKNTELLQTHVNKSGTWVKIQYGEKEYFCNITDISDQKT